MVGLLFQNIITFYFQAEVRQGDRKGGKKEENQRRPSTHTQNSPSMENFDDIYNFHMAARCDVINAKFLHFTILINLPRGSKQCSALRGLRCRKLGVF